MFIVGNVLSRGDDRGVLKILFAPVCKRHVVSLFCQNNLCKEQMEVKGD